VPCPHPSLAAAAPARAAVRVAASPQAAADTPARAAGSPAGGALLHAHGLFHVEHAGAANATAALHVSGRPAYAARRLENTAPSFAASTPTQVIIGDTATAVGARIFRAMASDPDSAVTPLGQMTFEIADMVPAPEDGATAPFAIDPSEGSVYLRVSQAAAAGTRYLLTLRVSDGTGDYADLPVTIIVSPSFCNPFYQVRYVRLTKLLTGSYVVASEIAALGPDGTTNLALRKPVRMGSVYATSSYCAMGKPGNLCDGSLAVDGEWRVRGGELCV
jgi:hypothetical protein